MLTLSILNLFRFDAELQLLPEIISRATSKRRGEAKEHIERHWDFRFYLLGIGEVAAASGSTSRIEELDLDLAYLESIFIALGP